MKFTRGSALKPLEQDRLVIGINSDKSVKDLGKKLLEPFSARVREVDAWVQYYKGMHECGDVTIVEIPSDPTKYVRDLRPDLMVLGNDYTPEQVRGLEYSGALVSIKRLPGYKTGARDGV